MNKGIFYKKENIHFFATTHRFESGQIYNATITITIGLQTEDFDEGTEYAMTQVTDETGLYEKEFAAGALPEGKYWAVIDATIDLVIVRETFHFRVMNEPMWLIGMF